jgi:hypothetical protein
MNRRNFFKFLGLGTAAVVVAPEVIADVLKEGVAPKGYATYVMGKDACFAFDEFPAHVTTKYKLVYSSEMGPAYKFIHDDDPSYTTLR